MGRRAGAGHPHLPAEAGHEHPDSGVAGRRIGQLHIAGRLRDPEAEAGEDLALSERGLEQPEEEIVGGDLALAGLQDGAQRHHRRRIVGRRVGVGDRAADGPAVAHLRIADAIGQAGEGRDRLPHQRRGGHVGVAGHGADPQGPAVPPDAGQGLDPGEVDQQGRARQPLLDRRQQRHAAGQ